MKKRLEIFETKRTFLRPFLVEDAEDLFELNADPEVLQFTGDKPFLSIAEARTFIRSYKEYTKYGYGRWAIIRKKDYELLGWCGLKYDPKTTNTDLGFRLKRTYWNMGFATETASASLQIGFCAYELPEIIGRAVTENLASIRVLEKVGMEFSHKTELAGKPAKQFSRHRSSYTKLALPESTLFSPIP
ncbi:MAG: GNAT family N-acetyltransferase [Bacteroidota bacterium]